MCTMKKIHLKIRIRLMRLIHIFRSDQISRSVVSDSLQPHESQHARPPCPSPTHGVHWDSRPSSQWCHPAVSSVPYHVMMSFSGVYLGPVFTTMAWALQTSSDNYNPIKNKTAFYPRFAFFWVSVDIDKCFVYITYPPSTSLDSSEFYMFWSPRC